MSSHLSPIVFPAYSCCSKSNLWASRTCIPQEFVGNALSLLRLGPTESEIPGGLPLALEHPTLCCSHFPTNLPVPRWPLLQLLPHLRWPFLPWTPSLPWLSGPRPLLSLLLPPWATWSVSTFSTPPPSRALVLAQSPLSVYPVFVGHFLENVFWSVVASQCRVRFCWTLPWQFHPTSWSQPTLLCGHKSRYASPSLRTDVSLLSTPHPRPPAPSTSLPDIPVPESQEVQNCTDIVIQIKLFPEGTSLVVQWLRLHLPV